MVWTAVVALVVMLLYMPIMCDCVTIVVVGVVAFAVMCVCSTGGIDGVGAGVCNGVDDVGVHRGCVGVGVVDA